MFVGSINRTPHPSLDWFLTPVYNDSCYSYKPLYHSHRRFLPSPIAMSSATATPLATQQPKSRIPSGLVAFPSVSQSLHSLSSATDVHGVSLQGSFARCTPASEAKVCTIQLLLVLIDIANDFSA